MIRAVVLFLLMACVLAGVVMAGPRTDTLDLVNERRIANGCRRLDLANDALQHDAHAWSVQMAEAGFISHSVLEIGPWSLVGEVVGVGTSIPEITRALFNSPEHRRILLDCRYDVMAVGLYFDNDLVWMTGRLYAR